MKTKMKWTPLWILLGILAVLVIGIIIDQNIYYTASEEALALMDASGEVTVSEIAEGLYVDGPGHEEAMIFYPGAKVECEAYLPICYAMAEQGIDCFIIKMPGKYAILGIHKADAILEQYSYEAYMMAGHSLGGAMAAVYTAENPDRVEDLLLLAAYSIEDIPDSVDVLTIYGSKDQVLNRNSLAKNQKHLPDTASEYVIEGGNHAEFGNYGVQNGDGTAGITADEQQKLTVELVVTYLINEESDRD